eukprot:126092-Pelagomonas_calceolata.AAC.6
MALSSLVHCLDLKTSISSSAVPRHDIQDGEQVDPPATAFVRSVPQHACVAFVRIILTCPPDRSKTCSHSILTHAFQPPTILLRRLMRRDAYALCFKNYMLCTRLKLLKSLLWMEAALTAQAADLSSNWIAYCMLPKLAGSPTKLS